MTKKVYLGKIIGHHGVKGLVKVKFYNETLINLNFYKNKTYIKNIKINLKKIFSKGKLQICKINELSSIEETSDFISEELWVKGAELEKINSNEYFHKDLIGCKVYNQDNQHLGKVLAIHNFGAGDLLELDENFKYMIRFYDLKKESIDIHNKVIRLGKGYEF
ncbi:MAG: ribosome maturation factor RimM [Pseudomonadota bacterium]|nr:ribosome maturation factor RimM [Pseudomonadota bacterium]